MKEMITRMLWTDIAAFISALALVGLIAWYVVERWTFIPRKEQRERFTERF